MFIKSIVKTDRNTGKSYNYYRICEGYRIGNKVRHRSILSLGKLEGIDSKEDKKVLADRIESLINGENLLFTKDSKLEIERYARKFAKRIIDEKLLDTTTTTGEIPGDKPRDYQTIDLNNIDHTEVRELGSEWLCKQTLDKLELADLLRNEVGFSESMTNMALTHIVSRAVYPASEHKTADWIQSSSSVSGLCDVPVHKVNRFKLYQASKKLYQCKEAIEQHLSTKTNELFDLQDKIIFNDLTNTYFEGRKANSKLAKFGRSKEKRSDAKLVALATVINAEGFIKYSRIYQGNISDPKTLEKTIKELSHSTSNIARKPVIVMDAGIVTEDNTIMLKAKGYDYICVSRTKSKDYKLVDPEKESVTISDNRNNPIELKLVEKPGCPDTYLHVRSQQKAVKEASMNEHFSQRYEEGLEHVREALYKKGGTKVLVG